MQIFILVRFNSLSWPRQCQSLHPVSGIFLQYIQYACYSQILSRSLGLEMELILPARTSSLER